MIDLKATEHDVMISRAIAVLKPFATSSHEARTLLQIAKGLGKLNKSQQKKIFGDEGYESKYLSQFGEPEVPPVPAREIAGVQKASLASYTAPGKAKATQPGPDSVQEDTRPLGPYSEETTPLRRAQAWAQEQGMSLLPTKAISPVFPFQMFNPVQSQAFQYLNTPHNLVVCAETSSGKTELSAVFAAHAINLGLKAIYLSPLRALSAEKYDLWSREDYLFSGRKVTLHTGDWQLTPARRALISKSDLLIFTSEILDSQSRYVASHPEQDFYLKDVGAILCDEAHLLGTKGRGGKLEAALIRLAGQAPLARIIMTSATMANAQEIGAWLSQITGRETILIESSFRPTQLGVHVVPYSSSFNFQKDMEAKVSKALELAQKHPDDQFLMFCHTKRDLGALVDEGKKRHLPVLSHHASLSRESRGSTEASFKEGRIRLLGATSTLCLHPDVLITSNRGPVSISELEIGDLVLTHTGKFERVLGVSKRLFSGSLLEIKAEGMPPVLMTEEHKVLIGRRKRKSSHSEGKWSWNKIFREDPKWVRAQELRESTRYEADEVLSPIEQWPPSLNPTIVQIHGKDFVGRNQFDSVFPHPYVCQVPKSVALNERTAEFFGLYVAEGCTGRNGVVLFYIATYEKDLTVFIKSCMRSPFNTHPKVTDKSRHRRSVRCCSRVLATFFDENFGRGAENKHFPETFLSAPLSVVRGLVRGAWLGDGTSTTQPHNSARYSTISPRLAEQMWRLLKRLGYCPSVYVKEPRVNGIGKHRIYLISLSGAQCGQFLVDIMNTPRRELSSINRTYNLRPLVTDSFRSPIRTVKRVPYTGNVYNLHVEGGESYTCSFAFTVHNSAGINLPARRVVILGVQRGPSMVSPTEIQQECVGETTRVLMSSGSEYYKQAKDINIGDRVVGVNRENRLTGGEVIRKVRSFSPAKKILFSNGTELILHNHMVLTYIGKLQSSGYVSKTLEWKNSEDLSIGDRVCITTKGVDLGGKNLKDIFYEAATRCTGIFCRITDMEKVKLKHYTQKQLASLLGCSETSIYKKRKNGILPMAEALKLGFNLRFLRSKNGHEIDLERLDYKRLPWFLGIAATDGCVTISKIHTRLRITQTQRNNNILLMCQEILESCGLQYSTRKSLNSANNVMTELQVSSYAFVSILNQLGIVPSKTKILSLGAFKGLTLPERALFISGVIDGDGSFDKKSWSVRIATASDVAARDLKDLLLSVGVPSCKYYYKGAPDRKVFGRLRSSFSKCAIVQINRVDCLNSFIDSVPISFKLPTKGRTLRKNIRPLIGDCYWTRVSAITSVLPQNLYDFTIRGISTFICEDIVTHNCGRAGRTGIDTRGDAYILVPSEMPEEDREALLKPQRVSSELGDVETLAFHLLSEIRSGVTNRVALLAWYQKTLWAFQNQNLQKLEAILSKVLQDLIEIECIQVDRRGEYRLSELGRISATYYFSPYDCWDWLGNLRTLWDRECWDHDWSIAWAVGDVHSYKCEYTPRSVSGGSYNVGRHPIKNETLPMIVAIYEGIRGQSKNLAPMGLINWWMQISSDSGRVSKVLHVLQETFLPRVFLDQRDLGIRLRKGVPGELVPLARVPGVGPEYARRLYEYGITSPDLLAASTPGLSSLLGRNADKIVEAARKYLAAGDEEDA